MKINYIQCDFCSIKIEGKATREAYSLASGVFRGCGGQIWHFCSLPCLKAFVISLEEELTEKDIEEELRAVKRK